MHTHLLARLIALAVLISPLSAYAQAAPSDVSGISAAYEDGKLTVHWNAVQDAGGIAQYRIYYSRTSILQNGGDYDDYEATGTNVTDYTFPVVPYYNTTLYLSVLAVNAAGVESDSFLEEAQVVIGAKPATVDVLPIPDLTSMSSSSVASTDPMQPMSSSSASADLPPVPFLMTHALTLSSNEVAINFTKDVAPTSQVNSGTIVIVTQSGARLPVLATRIEGMSVIATTEGQNPNETYTVAGVGPAMAMDGSPLLPIVTPVVFHGHPEGAPTQPVVSPPVRDTTPPEDVAGLQLRPVLQKDGTYNIVATWDKSPNSAADLRAYAVGTTRDGRLFGNESEFGKDESTVRYDHVTPGVFGIVVKAKDQFGNVSAGIAKVINLPQTGVGLLGMMAAAGAVAGRKVVKRKSGRR